ATTENPSFEINSALLSRMMVITLNPLSIEDIVKVLKNALSSKRGLGEKRIDVSEEIILEIAEFANGDARTALNVLEKVVYSSQFNDGVIKVTDETLKDCLQRKMLLYSKSGDEHFNLISALHKSMRNSDCNASVYWLARMFEAGEDPLYIARRLVRFASEDVGMADPNALPQAVAAYQAAHFIGRPECNVNLTQAVIYLASAPKSNALYVAYETARVDALNTLSEGVPLQLRNASTELLETLGYGKGYEYAHDNEMRIAKMDCLPEKMLGREYYKPTEEGFEEEIKKRLLENEKKKEKL
ncbi:MAG: replication-associated recombination protein A, partial [Lachnospiraceae bacterium]|nr:replication-associated recombination protein A [Lachnospiraceae bacterium]